MPTEEELSRERRAIQLAQARDVRVRHAGILRETTNRDRPDAHLARGPRPRVRRAAGGRPRASSTPHAAFRAYARTRRGEAHTGDRRGRVHPKRLDRARRASRSETHVVRSGRAARTHAGTDARRAAHGDPDGAPERARLRSLRTDGETWFASFSRSTLGSGSAETKRARFWQIAATSRSRVTRSSCRSPRKDGS